MEDLDWQTDVLDHASRSPGAHMDPTDQWVEAQCGVGIGTNFLFYWDNLDHKALLDVALRDNLQVDLQHERHPDLLVRTCHDRFCPLPTSAAIMDVGEDTLAQGIFEARQDETGIGQLLARLLGPLADAVEVV